MVKVTSPNSENKITVRDMSGNITVTTTGNLAEQYARTSQAWATSEGIVAGQDYSSKHYANVSKEYAEIAKGHRDETINTVSGFQDIVDNSKEEIEVIAQNNISNLRDSAETTMSEIQETIDSSLDTINTTVSENISTIESKANEEIENLNKEVEQGKDEIKDTIDGIKVLTTLEIGDIGIAPLGIDETKGLRRYLNGQVIIQDQYVQFTNKVKSAVALYPSLACTESEWQTTATMTVGGQVGKFVVDDEAGTIRLPKIIMPIQGLTDLSKLGKIVEAGLPTHTHTRGTMNITGYVAGNNLTLEEGGQSGGALYFGGGSYVGPSNQGAYYGPSINLDASRNWTGSTSTGNYSKALATTDTVQQEQIQYPYFIQVATGAETEDNIINEIELNNPYSFGDSKYSPVALNNLSWLKSEGQYNSKAVYPAYYDWALTNFNNGVEGFALSTGEYTDYDVVINPADETFRLPLLDGSEDLPSDRYDDLTLNASGSSYIAPANGWFIIRKTSNGAGQLLNLYNITTNIYSEVQASTSGVALGCYIPVRKGEQVRCSYSMGGSTNYFRFTYAQGNGSLYFYVGETVQNANLINAGRIEEKVASCITRNDCKAYIVESYVNGTSWYRVWSDSFKEQGGTVGFEAYTNNRTITITLLKPFSNTNYTSLAQLKDGDAYWANVQINVNQHEGHLMITQWTDESNLNVAANKVNWYACGY